MDARAEPRQPTCSAGPARRSPHPPLVTSCPFCNGSGGSERSFSVRCGVCARDCRQGRHRRRAPGGSANVQQVDCQVAGLHGRWAGPGESGACFHGVGCSNCAHSSCQGKLDDAERYLRRALQEARAGFDRGDAHVAAALNNLAELHRHDSARGGVCVAWLSTRVAGCKGSSTWPCPCTRRRSRCWCAAP